MLMNSTSNSESSFIKKLVPPPNWQMPVLILFGVMVGLGLYILYISNAVSYLSDKPEACVNCHVMAPQFATWQRSSHGRVTNCNDCHVPHDNFVRKYAFKAMDGLRHATMFTLRMEPQVIQIKQAGKEAVQENCIRCHSNNIHPISLRSVTNASIIDEGDRYCWDCHRTVPHGRVNSLSSAPYARVPIPASATTDWIDDFMKKNKEN
jgi:cytochrome c nitrite reductase small subunit